jgi:hypothetical protein
MNRTINTLAPTLVADPVVGTMEVATVSGTCTVGSGTPQLVNTVRYEVIPLHIEELALLQVHVVRSVIKETLFTTF